MTELIDLRLDVSDALPKAVTSGEPLHIAAWVFVPEAVPVVPTVVTLFSGGTYDRRYFHFDVPGRSDYSMAEYLRSRGHIVVLPDLLGVGASDRAKVQMQATRAVAAAASHAAVEQIYERLHEGSLSASLPAIKQFVKIGGGHSMGGFMTITQQAAHRTFDLCLILGYTADAVHLTIGGQFVRADPGGIDTSQPDYGSSKRSVLRDTFHWDDVPADVLAVDDSLAVDVPYLIGSQAATAGIVRDDAAAIDVPIYINLGERDVSPDPHAEPGFYKASRDITLHILPRSAHCQNFANTRVEMYDRIDRWVRDQAGTLG